MKRLLLYASLLLTGTVLGWWLRDATPGLDPGQPQTSRPTAATPQISSRQAELTPVALNTEALAPPAPEANGAPDTAHFEMLLQEQRFAQAIRYYESALDFDGAYQNLWKPRLEAYLRAGLMQCSNGAFIELVDLWLDTYYQDIPVLLLLAENQRLCSSPEEAARTLQIARTYALEPGLQHSVATAVAHLITTTDDHLSQQSNWIALLGFFEFLQAIDLSTRDSELRRATLYQLVGEHQRSQDLLVALREADNGSDPDWTAALNLQWSKSAPESSADDRPAQAIPLIRKGDHFLVSALINDVEQVLLMIDTGASVTTLAKSRFTDIDGPGFGYRGSRLFNTANGIAPGKVYQANSLTLGNTRLSVPDIAVLDYESTGGVDGLLGMNILRNYRFEIDQDNDLLYLHPRE
ncbi:MAG: clan AA aspartic protease [Halioglobus sp.]|nr:clan AA aspartic protease [Halioglobus sp.]